MSLGTREKAGYGLGDMANHLVFDTVVLFLMYFYTDIVGLPPAAVGTMFLVTRILDGFIDFSMGLIADRTRTRWGRFRPWLVWMALPLTFLSVMTFWSPGGDEGFRLVYAWITYAFLMAAYSAINIPYGALSGVMTSNPLERTSLNAWRMGLARVGSVIVSGATVWLVGWTGQGDEAAGYFRAVLAYACLAFFLYLACFAMTRERTSAGSSANPVRTDLGMLTRNRPWIVLFILGIVLFANMVVSLSSTIYYVRTVVGDASLIGTFMLAGSLATFIGVPFTRASVRRFGKKPTFIAAQLGVAILMAAMYFVAPASVHVILLLRTAAFALIWFSSPLLWTMIGDSADYGECRLGVRATGVIFSAATCAHKMGMGLGGAVVGWMLGAFGYADVAVQSQSAVEGIRILHCLVPAAGSLLLAAIMTAYPLSDADCEAMERELASKSESAAA